jgi:SAM-dependent methyltransferase
VSELDSWGYQWLTFDDFAPEVESEFADILSPLDVGQFEGAWVLDAGCGNGRFTRACAALGPRRVIGLDPSHSVFAARANTAGLPNATVLQGDIYRLPFPPAHFDHVFCIGVIHHLPDPRAGFEALAQMLKPGGKISIWVYAREGNELVIRYLEPLRKGVTSKLPWGLTKGISALAAVALWLLVTLLYRPARALWPALYRRLPMHDYLWYIYSLGFYTLYHTAFDKLSPELCAFLSQDELRAWFAEAGLEDVIISFRNGNSWRAQGRRPRAGTRAPESGT